MGCPWFRFGAPGLLSSLLIEPHVYVKINTLRSTLLCIRVRILDPEGMLRRLCIKGVENTEVPGSFVLGTKAMRPRAAGCAGLARGSRPLGPAGRLPDLSVPPCRCGFAPGVTDALLAALLAAWPFQRPFEGGGVGASLSYRERNRGSESVTFCSGHTTGE